MRSLALVVEREVMSAANMRTVVVMLISVAAMSIVRLTPAQTPTTRWTVVDHENDVWQRDLEDGSHEFISLPHPPYVLTATSGLGAAWGGRIDHDGTIADWFTLQYMGLTNRGIEVAMRRGVASERSRHAFQGADHACLPSGLSVCRARAIMWALLDGDGPYDGPGTRTVLSNRPFSIGLSVSGEVDRPVRPDLILTFDDARTSSLSQLRLTLARP